MRKITIVEIENSFLNLFTPAVIIAAGYFLFNLIGWPVLFIEWTLEELDVRINVELFDLMMVNLALILVTIIVYLVIIPRLKVRDATYEKVNYISLIVTILLVCIVISFQTILTNIFNILKLEIKEETLTFTFEEFINPPFLIAYLFWILIANTLFSEFVYRRTIIPLLEDRGVSPIFSVILSALGYSFINFPGYFLSIIYPDLYENNLINIIHQITFVILFGICAGLIYIFTRNILFPVLFGIIFHSYNLVENLGNSFGNNIFIMVYDLLSIISLAASLAFIFYTSWILINQQIIPEWLKIIRKRSVPNIKRGIAGFFFISLGLLLVQTFVIVIGREVTNFYHNYPQNLPQYFIYVMVFYLIAFTVPFWLTISTEYARD
ncbi:MAG: type II CAAX prenyl endopeptidase Rce1 family protein [Candidatus Hodarchaeota archaeon]